MQFVPIQYSENDENTNVGTASRETWKRQRTIMNSTFTPMRLKEVQNNVYIFLIYYIHYYYILIDLKLFSLMNKCTDVFMENVKNCQNKEFNISG